MIKRHEVLLSLYGAWRLFLRDPRGIEWLDDSIEGYWKSFFCAVVILPGYALWVAFSGGGVNTAGLFRVVTVESISYVIQWTAWPLLMAYLTPAIGRDDNYIRYIVAFNWSMGVQIAVYLVVLAVKLTGFAPEGLVALISVVAMIVVLSYHWFILRVALEVSGIGAVALVTAEFILAQIIYGVGQVMLH